MDLNLRIEPKSEQRLSLIASENPHIHNLLDVYPVEVYDKLLKNKEKLLKIAESFKDVTKGVSKAVMLMKCQGQKCVHATSCVLLKNDLAPEDYYCPVEMKVTMELETSLVDELEIDPQSTIEMELLYDLIDAKLLDMRSSGLLSKGGLIQQITVSAGKNTITTNDIAPEFKIKMDIKKLKHSIMNDFIATRRAKKRYGLGTGQGGLEDIIKEALERKNND